MGKRIKNKYEILQRLSASVEGAITPQSLLQEIEPLIGEYFVTEINLTAEEIILSFYNGQKFSLKIEEIRS